MLKLLLSPRNFFEKQQEEPTDLWLPSLIVVLTSGFGFGIARLISSGIYGAFPSDIQSFVWRLTLLTGGLAVIGSILLWPLVSGIIAGTAILLWNRDSKFKKLVELIGFAHIPYLISGFITFLLLLLFPVPEATPDLAKNGQAAIQDYLYNNNILGTSSYISLAMSVWAGLLIVFAVRSHFRLSALRALLTVSLPFCAYKVVVFFFAASL